MRIFGWTVARTKALSLPPPTTPAGGWYPIVREPFIGAWQKDLDLRPPTVLTNPTVFRCVSLIATDVPKCRCRLMELDDDGIWTETTSPAFSPVLRHPNSYQTPRQFFEQWVISRLLHGNVYVRKWRDARGIVTALTILDPARVKVLVAPDGGVYYELQRDDLAGISEDAITRGLVLPASEIIHDRWNTLFHPLIGVSPLYACGGAALQGIQIQQSSTAQFANASAPGGVVMVPTSITEEQVQKIREMWLSVHGGPNQGGTGILSGGATYQAVSQTAVDSQLTEQLGWTAKTIAGAFGVPISMVDSSQQPPYANSEASTLQYRSQCLQTHFTGIESSLDAGLELPEWYGTEFDIDDLVWMDTATKTAAAREAIGSGAMAPNEARFQYFNLKPVPGGDTPYLQQQYWPLGAKRTGEPAPPPAPMPAPEPEPAPAPEPDPDLEGEPV